MKRSILKLAYLFLVLNIMDYTLVANKRTNLKKKSKYVRKKGLIPAVVYGYGFDNINIEVDAVEFKNIYKNVGSTGFIDLKVENKELKVLIKAVNKALDGKSFNHIDFYAINEKVKIKLFVPIEFINESPLLNKGCLVVKGLSKVYVEALPFDIPSKVLVDLSTLTEVGKPLLLSDLDIPKGVKFLSPLGSRIVSMTQTRAYKASVELDSKDSSPSE